MADDPLLELLALLAADLLLELLALQEADILLELLALLVAVLLLELPVAVDPLHVDFEVGALEVDAHCHHPVSRCQHHRLHLRFPYLHLPLSDEAASLQSSSAREPPVRVEPVSERVPERTPAGFFFSRPPNFGRRQQDFARLFLEPRLCFDPGLVVEAGRLAKLRWAPHCR